MRNNLSILVCMVLLASSGVAQGQKAAVAQRLATPVPPTQLVLREIPLEMTRRYSAFKPALKPSAKSWVEQQARQEAQRPVPDVAALKNIIRSRFTAERSTNSSIGYAGTDADIMAVAFIVMMEAEKSAREDLKAIMAQVKAMNEAKQKLRDLAAGVNAAMGGGSVEKFGGPSARCRTPFCLSLPSKLNELAVATRGFQRPVQLYAPPDPSFATLSGLQVQMKSSLDSLGSLSSLEEMRLQKYMERRAKLLDAISIIMSKTNDAQASIIQNLK